MSGRKNIASGTTWEAIAGYSRAVKLGSNVHVSGTTATDEKGEVVGIDDPYAQTVYIIQKIERALKEAGATLNDVVRTRIYVTDASRWNQSPERMANSSRIFVRLIHWLKLAR